MSKFSTLEEGQLLLYKGKEFEDFDNRNPYMNFLGYDSSGWTDLWVLYKGTKMRVDRVDVEPATSK
jgi:hypothetical protein